MIVNKANLGRERERSCVYSSSALMRVLQGLVLSTRMSKRTASRHHFALAYGGESIAFSVQEVLTGIVRVLHFRMLGRSRSKCIQTTSYSLRPRALTTTCRKPTTRKTSAKLEGTQPTSACLPPCGMSTQFCARRLRKVCRISRIRIPQACVTEARKLHVSRAWVHQEVRLHVCAFGRGGSAGGKEEMRGLVTDAWLMFCGLHACRTLHQTP